MSQMQGVLKWHPCHADLDGGTCAPGTCPRVCRPQGDTWVAPSSVIILGHCRVTQEDRTLGCAGHRLGCSWFFWTRRRKIAVGPNHGLWPEPWAGMELESWLVGPHLGRGLQGPPRGVCDGPCSPGAGAEGVARHVGSAAFPEAPAVPGSLGRGAGPRGAQSGRTPLCMLERWPLSDQVGLCLQLAGKASSSVLPVGAGLTFQDTALSSGRMGRSWVRRRAASALPSPHSLPTSDE